ncbi:hypothetical protein HGK72_26895 [Mycolicibacterium fortuitum]|uniref:DUF7423 domain-containing protein n=1 Tax=Mycolicibacterium fortuitum TaxID=1766 RepID=UPI0014903BA3|nr:hypothetical protein [Mycolicibacterium fortuitum]
MASETMIARIDDRLVGLPDTAIALALGMSVANPKAQHVGRVSALVDELARRGVLDSMLAALGPELAGSIRLAARADRGQCWARTGKR